MNTDKTITFYYVRHGKTVYNKEGIMQGQVESPLLKEGIPTLQNTADALSEIRFDRCFASPLLRAMDTAKIVLNGRDLAVEPITDLQEMNFGSLDGTPHKDHLYRIMFLFLINNFKPVHGESGREVQDRVRKAFNEMIENCDDGDQVLVVSHGTYYWNLLHALFHKNKLQLKIEADFKGMNNGDVSVIRYEKGNFRLISYPMSGEEFSEMDLEARLQTNEA